MLISLFIFFSVLFRNWILNRDSSLVSGLLTTFFFCVTAIRFVSFSILILSTVLVYEIGLLSLKTFLITTVSIIKLISLVRIILISSYIPILPLHVVSVVLSMWVKDLVTNTIPYITWFFHVTTQVFTCVINISLMDLTSSVLILALKEIGNNIVNVNGLLD